MRVWGLWFAEGYGDPDRRDLIEFPTKADAWSMMEDRFHGFEGGVHFPLCGTQYLQLFHSKPLPWNGDWYPDEILYLIEKETKNGRSYTKRVDRHP